MVKLTMAQQFLDATAKHHDAVREVAKIMCTEMGLDPDAMVHCNENDPRRFTPYEEVFYLVDELSKNTIEVKRWELFRHQASLALAGWQAVHQYALAQ